MKQKEKDSMEISVWENVKYKNRYKTLIDVKSKRFILLPINGDLSGALVYKNSDDATKDGWKPVIIKFKRLFQEKTK